MGNKVKFFRMQKRLRQVDLARIANISIGTLWLIENDFDERTSREIKEKICEALKLKLEQVFPNESENLKQLKLEFHKPD